MLKILLKFNPLIWVILLVVLCVMDHQEWEENVYQPLLQTIEAKKIELQGIQATLARIEEFRAQKDQKLAEYNRLLDEFENVRKEFPATPELPSLLKSLADIGERIGMEFSSFKPAGNVPVELLEAAQIEVKLRGSYVQIMSFLDAVSNIDRIVNTESLDLKAGSTQENRQFKTVEADLKILTYYGGQGG
jgi:Tfp pilus assembly protein PilO